MVKPLTIVMIGQKGLPARSGGIERHVSSIATGLVARGYRVVVYGRRWYVGNGQAPAGVEQHFSTGIRTKHLDAVTHSFTALWKARQVKPDVIHLQGSSVALLAPIARLFHPRAKLVVTFHCIDAGHAKWNWLAKKILRLGEWIACNVPDKTIVVSQTLLRDCLKRFSTQTVYISHPFDIDKNQVPTEPLAQFGLVKDQYLISAGRLVPNKHIHLLIQAYAKVREMRPELFAHIPLVIVGGGVWTDSYVSWLAKLAATVPNVKLLGERSGMELAALQAHAMAHVFPTLTEGLSFAMLEAGAFARPAVATALPQNEEALGASVIKVRVNDVDDLARGLMEMVLLSPEERQKMGEETRAHVERAFHPVDRIDDLDRFYRELCGQPRELVSSTLGV
jgi:glycosyltransferase involved in cell wall biosynthesis